MGKRIFAKFFVAVPLTASIIVSPVTISKRDQINILDRETVPTQYYEVEEKFKQTELDKVSFEVDGGFWKKEGNNQEKKSSKLKIKDKEDSGVKETEIIPVEKQEIGGEKAHLEKIEKMIGNSPMAKMIPYLEKQDPITAAFLVAIAKKESNWGKISPRTKSGECFNYWGFKDRRFKFVAGHSCFPSAEVAVETVGKRIDNLVAKGKDTPAEMVVWKCGSACAKDGGAGKWISDVNLYFKPIVASVAH